MILLAMEKIDLREDDMKWEDACRHYGSCVGDIYESNHQLFRHRVYTSDDILIADIYADVCKVPADRYKYNAYITVCPIFTTKDDRIISLKVTHIGEYFILWATRETVLKQVSHYVSVNFEISYVFDKEYPYSASYTNRIKKGEENKLLWKVTDDGISGIIKYIGGGRDSELPFKYTIGSSSSIIELNGNSTNIDISKSVWGSKDYNAYLNNNHMEV